MEDVRVVNIILFYKACVQLLKVNYKVINLKSNVCDITIGFNLLFYITLQIFKAT